MNKVKLLLVMVLMLVVSSMANSQTTFCAGTGGASSFSPGGKTQFKEFLISQVNHTFGKFTASEVTIGVIDTIANGYIGENIGFQVFQSQDSIQQVFVGVDFLKGEMKKALFGASVSLRQKNTLIGLFYQRDVVKGENWVGASLQQFITF